MTETEADARRGRVVDVLNALSNLERDDLYYVLTKNNTVPDWLADDLEKIKQIVADHHPDEFAEARARVWECVLLAVLDQAGDLPGAYFKEDGNRDRDWKVRPSFDPCLWERRGPPSTA
jgi:hypothetical protein